MKNELKLSIWFTIIVIILSWSLIFIVFSDNKTIDFYHLVMFIPAIVGITLNFVLTKSFKAIFKPLTNRINLKSIIFSVFFPIIFIVIIAFFAKISHLAVINPSKLYLLKTFPNLFVIIIGLLLIFGEEYGWRGFLLNYLTPIFGKIKATFYVAVVWALWHVPLIYLLADFYNFQHPLLLTIVQFISVLIMSFAFSYSYYLSNNILAPIILHFLWNWYNPMILGNIYENKLGIMEGNLLIINGEGIAGIFLGLFFVAWFINKHKVKQFIKYVI